MRVNSTQTIGDLPCIHELPVFREPVWAVESSITDSQMTSFGELRGDARQILSYNGAIPRSPGAPDSKWIHTFTLSAIARTAVDTTVNEDSDDSIIGTPVESPNEENIELEIHPVDELVTIRNVSNSETVLTGYHLNFEAGEDSQVDRIRQLAGEVILRAGEEVTIATGAGEEGDIPLEEPYDGGVLNNEDPDVVALLDENENFVAASETLSVESRKDPDHTSISSSQDPNSSPLKVERSSTSIPPNDCESDILRTGDIGKNQITLDVDSDHVEIWTEVVEDYERFFTLQHFLNLEEGEGLPECIVDEIGEPEADIITGLFEDNSDSGEDDFKHYLTEFYNDDDIALEEIKESAPEGIDHAAFTFAKGGAMILAPRLHPAVGAGATALSVGKLLWETWEAYQGPDGHPDNDVEFSSQRDVGQTGLEGHQMTFHLLVDPVEQGSETVPLTFKSNFGKIPPFAPDTPLDEQEEWEAVTEVEISRKPYPDWSGNAKMNWPRYYRENHAIPDTYDQELIGIGTNEPDISINVPDEVTFGETFNISASITPSDQIDPELYVWGIYDEDGPVAEEDCGIVSNSATIPNPDFQAAAQGFCNDESLGTTTVDLVIFDQSGVTWHRSAEFEVTPGPGPSAEIDGPTLVEDDEEATWHAYGSEGKDLNYTWSGDVSGSGPEVTETFRYEGDRTIELKVEDEYGRTDSTTQEVSVTPPMPSAVISGPTVIEDDEEATWDAHDSEGEDLNYTWSGDVSGNGLKVTKTFNSEGNRVIKLEVKDQYGRSDSTTHSFDVIETTGPSATIDGPTSVELGEEATWDAHDSEGEDLTYTWSGDVSGHDPEVVETFGSGGTRTIRLDVVDKHGLTDDDWVIVAVKPLAEISGPKSIDLGEEATWNAHNSEGENLSYTWRETIFDEDLGSSPEITKAFESPSGGEPGSRTIELEIEDKYGQTNTDTLSVILGSSEPVAEIDGPTLVDPDEKATWSAYDSEGEDLSYSWSGDVSGNGPEVTETFSSEGDRTIELEVEDEYGRTDSTSQEVSLLPPPPSAVISGPKSIDPGEKATWDAHDSEGEGLIYTWRETRFDEHLGSSPEITKAFESPPGGEPGGRTIKLEVKDEYGQTDSATQDISVTPPLPSAEISGPKSVEIDEKATWDAHDSEGENLSYSWSGDVSGNGPKITETFSSEGNRTIELEVEDESGRTASTTQEVSVTPPVPSAVISGPKSVEISEEATWDAYDSEGENLSYTWSGDVSGTGPEVTEIFSSEGDHTIKLTIEDQYGQTVSTTWDVSVISPISAEISGPKSVESGEKATWDAYNSEGEDLSYTWSNDVSGSGPEITRTFEFRDPEPGGRIIKLEVEDKHGRTDSTTHDVALTLPPISAEIDGPTTVEIGEEATWTAYNSKGDGLSYTWSGDVSGTSPEVTEIFSSEGDHTIKLEIEDEYGQTDSTTQSVTVTAPPISAEISGPESVEPGEKATWDAHDSQGEDLSYTWRETAVTNEHLGSGPEITKAFESPPGGEPGGRTIELEVEDQYGQTDTETFSVLIDAIG